MKKRAEKQEIDSLKAPDTRMNIIPTRSTSQPERSGYNPHAAKDGHAAKLWELLRRNPDFREYACSLSNINLSERTGHLQFNENFQKLDAQNPFASLALRWLFRPNQLEFYFPRLPHNFLKPITTNELIEIGAPWLSEEWLFELEQILSDENNGLEFSGPLTITNGPFCLDTPWRHTPVLFKFLFHWLWEDYSLDSRSSTFAAYQIKHGLEGERDLQINWSFLDRQQCSIDGRTRADLLRLKTYIQNHKLFSVPRIVMTRHIEKILIQNFTTMLKDMHFVDVRKYPGVFGNENEWQVFDYCRSNITYERDSNRPEKEPQRTGFGSAIKGYIQAQYEAGKWNEESKWEAHVKKDYEKMQTRMLAVFPKFDFSKLLTIGLKVNSDQRIANASLISFSGAVEKLKFIAKSLPDENPGFSLPENELH